MKPIDCLTPEELRVECAEAMGWKLIAKGSKNPTAISFRLCPICGYYGSRHEGRSGMAPIEEGTCPESHESHWVSAFDQWTLDDKECDDDPPLFDSDANAALTLADALAENDAWEWKAQGDAHGVIVQFSNDEHSFEATATGPHAFALAMSRAYLAVIRSIKNAQ